MITAERKKELDALRAKSGVVSSTSSLKAKVLARAKTAPVVEEPKKGMQERLADVGFDVKDQITGAIKGEGKYEGESSIRRGVEATASAFSTIPRGLFAMAPDAVREPLEKVGTKIGEGIKNNVIDPLAETSLIKGAAGREEIQPDGTVKYVANDKSLGEEILGTVGAAGELAGTVLGGETSVLTKSASLANRIMRRAKPTVSTTAKVVTAPVRAMGEPVNNAIKYGASQVTGLEPSEISTIFKNPEKFSKKARESVDRDSFAKSVADDIKKRESELSDLGEGYNVIRESGGKVNVNKGEISKSLDQKFKIKYDGKKVVTDKESTPLTEGERGQLESFLAKYSDTDEMSANAFLNARKALDGMSKFHEAGSSGGLKTIARSLRYQYDQAGKAQLKGLKELDDLYGPERKDLKILAKELFVQTGETRGELKPGALSKLANLTGKGKEGLLKRMEKMRPGITEEVNIMRAVEGIDRATGNKVGTYTRSIIGGGVLFGGNPGWALLAIASYPKIAVNIIRSAGMVARFGSKMIDSVNDKIKAGKTLTAPEKEVVKEALKQPKPSRKVRKVIEEKAPEAYERVFKSSRSVKLDKDAESVVSPIQKKNVKQKVKVGEVARETVKKEVQKSVSGSVVSPLSTSGKKIVKSKIEKIPLRGKDAKIQKKSIEMYDKNPTKLLKAYKALPGVNGGKLINADEARKLFKKIGYVGSNSQAVQEASSQIAKDVWRDMLATTKRKEVFITAGGSGSGKTSAMKKMMGEDTKNSVVLDGNLSKVRSAMQRMEEAIDAGKKPVVVYTYRDPIDAWENGVIKRMLENADEGGRVVPLSVFLQNHKGSYNVVKKLRKLGVDTRVIDNSRGEGKQKMMSADKFEKIRYDDIESKLRGIVEEKYKNGIITKTQKNKLLE